MRRTLPKRNILLQNTSLNWDMLNWDCHFIKDSRETDLANDTE